ncbi:hypothetical protein [Micromonospora chalcea]|uniref:hypothetical protein n=1 Tax=Micromonospora chalcea TaxID=1874 RepID=UPI003D743879
MTWFKVDDGLHKHRKRIRVGIDADGISAMGLWVIAGSWCADELTDGFVPDDVLAYLVPGPRGRRLAARLQRGGLWRREQRDGVDGWQFHDWLDKNPSREQILAERAAAAARQQRARDRAQATRHGVTHGDVTPAVTAPPTRPDPTRTPSPALPASDAGFTPRWVEGVVAAVLKIRTDWLDEDVRRALAHPKVRARPAAVVAHAAILVAADPATNRPSRLAANHTYWSQARRAVDASRATLAAGVAPHAPDLNDDGDCRACPLPARHPVHRRTPPTPEGTTR